MTAAIGKGLREKTPRKAHDRWIPPHHRRDPISILKEADAKRLPELVPIRYGRMLQSPFAFYRGSAAIMAADLAHTPSTGIEVQACGDCHLMNFGGFATPERNLVFDINDFDETHPAPWEWDVKRLAASFVLAARANGFTDEFAQEVAEASTRSYREHAREYAKMSPLEVWYARIGVEDFLSLTNASERGRIERRVDKAMQQPGSDAAYPKLTHVVNGTARIKDTPPLIFHPVESREPEFRHNVDEYLDHYRSSLADDRRPLFDQYHFVDAAIKVVGIGSVGTRCWIALMMSPFDQPLFLQFKEANDSVLEPYTAKGAYAHNGQRVVNGQRLMQSASDIFLGWMTGPDNRQFYVRQLRDAKISARVETFDEHALEVYAGACGWTLARAHSKGGDTRAIGSYLGSGDAFDEAIGRFAIAYADQAESDYEALKAAVRKGEVEVFTE